MTINITTITMTIAITRTTLAAYQITSMLFNWTLSQNLKNNYSWNTEAQRTTMVFSMVLVMVNHVYQMYNCITMFQHDFPWMPQVIPLGWHSKFGHGLGRMDAKLVLCLGRNLQLYRISFSTKWSTKISSRDLSILSDVQQFFGLQEPWSL